MKSTVAPAGNRTRASGLPPQRATTALPGARYLPFEIQDSYICTLKSSFDKSDWAARPKRELLPRPDAAGPGEYLFETRTCFDHSGLIRKAREQESASRRSKVLSPQPGIELHFARKAIPLHPIHLCPSVVQDIREMAPMARTITFMTGTLGSCRRWWRSWAAPRASRSSTRRSTWKRSRVN